MTQEQKTTAISIMHPVCCGLDVHKMKNDGVVKSLIYHVVGFLQTLDIPHV